MTTSKTIGDLIDMCCRSGILAVSGGNFSGKTALLRLATGLSEMEGDLETEDASTPGQSVYVGPEIYNSLSGLASTVEDELRIHELNCLRRPFVDELIEAAELRSLFDRNPFLVSGGEQACLAVISALLLGPALLALDGALEQLEFKLRTRFLGILGKTHGADGRILITDNRLTELEETIDTVPIEHFQGAYRWERHLSIGPLRAEPITELSPRPGKKIVIDGLSFRYPHGPEVLCDASLILDSQRPYLLTGKNGSGKSTFAKILVGVLKPSSGELMLGDRQFKPWAQPGQVVGYHFQNPDLQLFETTVWDELQSSMRRLKRDNSIDEIETKLILAAFGLSDLESAHPLGLAFPFVLRKRVGLAATLSMRTQWVILDEPTLGQDEKSSQTIADIVQCLVKLGTGVIVISHSIRFRELLGAQHIVLENGRFLLSE